jgi:hypothetical protein
VVLGSFDFGNSPAFAPASSNSRTVSRSPLAAPEMMGLTPALFPSVAVANESLDESELKVTEIS